MIQFVTLSCFPAIVANTQPHNNLVDNQYFFQFFGFLSFNVFALLTLCWPKFCQKRSTFTYTFLFILDVCLHLIFYFVITMCIIENRQSILTVIIILSSEWLLLLWPKATVCLCKWPIYPLLLNLDMHLKRVWLLLFLSFLEY